MDLYCNGRKELGYVDLYCNGRKGYVRLCYVEGVRLSGSLLQRKEGLGMG